MNENPPQFEGFKGEVFNAIKNSGNKGILFKELKSKFTSSLLDTKPTTSATSLDLYGTLVVLKNDNHVKINQTRSLYLAFEDGDVFSVM